jgi:hypothetical protein
VSFNSEHADTVKREREREREREQGRYQKKITVYVVDKKWQ